MAGVWGCEVSDQLNDLLLRVLDELSDVKAQLEQLNGTPSKLVSTGEAAQMLDISENTLRSWHLEGKMPKNLGQGRHLKFERTAIERMAKAIRTGRPRKAA